MDAHPISNKKSRRHSQEGTVNQDDANEITLRAEANPRQGDLIAMAEASEVAGDGEVIANCGDTEVSRDGVLFSPGMTKEGPTFSHEATQIFPPKRGSVNSKISCAIESGNHSLSNYLRDSNKSHGEGKRQF